jgi:hypothetical protein
MDRVDVTMRNALQYFRPPPTTAHGRASAVTLACIRLIRARASLVEARSEMERARRAVQDARLAVERARLTLRSAQSDLRLT